MTVLLLFIGLVVFILAAGYGVLKSRNMHLWFFSYLAGKLRKAPAVDDGPVHIMFCFVDHYEPQWRQPDYDTEVARVKRWVDDYPPLADRHRDADGVCPQHTFFYPEEEYRAEHLDAIADLCRRGYGEIEIHLHHEDDTAENLTDTLLGFVKTLRERHGALSTDPNTGKPVYSFIHGNWCLDNARPDGRHCGVDEELLVLRDTGCYADFTLPAAPDISQTSKINSIYYAKNMPGRNKSHDTGVDMRVGGQPSGDLLIMQGPLTLNWQDRKFGLMPKIENSDVRDGQLPTDHRVDLWVDSAIHVKGRPEWRFIKVHTHGTQEPSMPALLDEPADAMYSYLESAYNDGDRYCLHYVSAREMYNIAKAAESGASGNPNQYRDFVLPRPSFQSGQ